MSYGIGLLFWWLGGAWSWYLLDRREMAKDVQYDSMPSGVPLSNIRAIGFVVMMVFGPIYAVLVRLTAAMEWHANRRLRRFNRELEEIKRQLDRCLERNKS